MKRYVFAGLIVFLLVLVVSFPARVAYDWFAPADMQLSGISGSIWNGRAAEGMAVGAYVQDISWKLKPASILSGKLAFATSSRPASGSLRSDVAVSLDGSLSLSNVSGALPLDLAHPMIQQNGISGDINLEFSSLVFQNGMPVNVVGSVTVANFFHPGMSSARLGDYRADFQTIDGEVLGIVDDLSGVLDVLGTISLLPDRTYALTGQVAARPDAPPSVTQQLQFLGSPDERGFRPFRFEGSL